MKIAMSFFGLLILYNDGGAVCEAGSAEGLTSIRTPVIGDRINRSNLNQWRLRLKKSIANSNSLSRMAWRVDDEDREALVFVPKPHLEKMPVVFAFHGHGGSSEYAARKLAFHEQWPDAICIYPQGMPTPVPIIDPNGRFAGWQKSIGDQDDRDLRFFDAMLASIKSDYSIDEKRIYVAGHSNGGFFTYTLIAARDDVFAAAAPIAGCIVPKDFASQKPIPVMHVAGRDDKLVRFALQERSIEQVLKLNRCSSPGKVVGDGRTFYSSETGTSVVTYLHPGGHEIPVDAVEQITQFFKDHRKSR